MPMTRRPARFLGEAVRPGSGGGLWPVMVVGSCVALHRVRRTSPHRDGLEVANHRPRGSEPVVPSAGAGSDFRPVPWRRCVPTLRG
jgi:hypothetical protein